LPLSLKRKKRPLVKLNKMITMQVNIAAFNNIGLFYHR